MCWEAFGQQVEELSRFEIADVRVSAKTGARMRAGLAPGRRYEIRSATMLDLIRISYGFDGDKILGGPTWLETDRFDITATAPADPTPETLKAMMRLLLADRFKLVVHTDARPFPAFVLKAGPKPRMTPANGSEAGGCRPQPLSASRSNGVVTGSVNGIPIQLGPDRTISYSCHNITMASFAEGLPRMFGVNLGNGPMLDRTGLKGSWDFNVRWSFMLSSPPTGWGDWISVFDAIDKQLGLKLEQEPIQTPVIVVDKVNENPTANPPGVAIALPETPPLERFDLAVIKPTDPTVRRSRFQMEPGGRFIAQRMELSYLVERALHGDNDDPVVGLPSWASSAYFDILAQGPHTSMAVDIDAIGPMLHSLLVERFKLRTHAEKQPVAIYELVALKPKMKKADSGNRSRCANSVPPPGTPPASSRMINCQNTTMSQFAAQLKSLAGSYIDSRVLDGTGIEGSWDFSLSFSPPLMLRSTRGLAAADSTTPAASEPNGAITIFEALQSQLGLKLVERKRSMSVIIVDHLEKKPTDN